MSETPIEIDRVTERVRVVAKRAMAAAGQAGKADVDVEDLLRALSCDGGIAQFILIEIGWMDHGNPIVGQAVIGDCRLRESAFITKIIEIAREEAAALHHRYPGTEHILLAVVRTYPQVFKDPDLVRHEIMKILGLELPKR